MAQATRDPDHPNQARDQPATCFTWNIPIATGTESNPILTAAGNMFHVKQSANQPTASRIALFSAKSSSIPGGTSVAADQTHCIPATKNTDIASAWYRRQDARASCFT